MIDPNTPIDYRYLNMDTGKFVDSQAQLGEEIGKVGVYRSLMSVEHGQVLIGGGQTWFTEFELRAMSQWATGIIKWKPVVGYRRY